jgi:hypothetical protein
MKLTSGEAEGVDDLSFLPCQQRSPPISSRGMPEHRLIVIRLILSVAPMDLAAKLIVLLAASEKNSP